MRRLAALSAAMLLWTGTATAQEPLPPDVPSGPASVRGRIVHEERPEAVAGVMVVLYSLTDGQPGLRHTTSSEDGAFVFEDISNDPSTVYLVGARSGDVPFGARVVFGEGETERTVELRLADPVAETSSVAADAVRLRIDIGCTHLRVREAHGLENASDDVILIAPEDRAGARPLLEVTLPENAVGFETLMGALGDGFEQAGSRVRFWGPLYPGQHDVEFGYGIPIEAEAATLRIGLPNGAERVEVLADAAGLVLTAPGLRPGSERSENGRRLRSAELGPIEAGGVLALDVAIATATDAPDDRLATPSAQLWLELDDTILEVNEQYTLEVAGHAPLVSRNGAPLACIPLPTGAEGLRFSTDALEWGLTRDPAGALALHGPIPPGENVLALRYSLPVVDDPPSLERRFERPVAALHVLIADNGIAPESERLHRLRPFRQNERNHIHLEGFAIEAGETISLRLERLTRGSGLPSLASSGLVLLMAAGALAFLLVPLRSGPDDARPDLAPAGTADERELVYRVIEDLDDDFETGKVSAEDHARMRAELRARAVALLREERDAADGSAAAPAAAAQARCHACAEETRPDDRFCAHCGAQLAEPAA